MTSIQDFDPSSVVLVTGANGHVAQHVLSQLLARPASNRPRVRATVRSEKSAKALSQVFGEYLSAGTLEIVRVSDITTHGAFDDVLKGCTHIAHIASPLVVNPKDTVNDLLKPAIQGTCGLLESAAKVDSIKAVVITSSFAAVFDPSKDLRPGYTYSEMDWSPLEYDQVADPNLDTSQWPSQYSDFVTYLASKKLAEKAAWDFHERYNPSWTLSVINPTYIGGPCIIPLEKGSDSFSYSNNLLWSIANSKPDDKLPAVDFPAWVDVRDVARAHTQALTLPEAAGKRFILAPYQVNYTAFADVVRQKFPDLSPSKEIQTKKHYAINTEQAERILGLKSWVRFEDMVADTVNEVRKWETSTK